MREGIMRAAREHGNPRRPIPTPSTGTKERVSPKASANANGTGSRAVRGSTSGGADADASCRITRRRVGDDEAIRAVRRADTDAPCGYRCAVRVTGQASSCAHILSHPLSAACRPVSPRRAYLSKVEVAQPLPRESSLGRPSGMISRGSYAILVWVDGIGIVRVSPLGAAVRAVSCRASPVCSRRARAYLV